MSESPRQTAEPLLPGEAGPRITAAIARRLAPELAVALRAADQFRRRPALALAVVFLASVAFLSNLLSMEIMAARNAYPASPRDIYLRSLETRQQVSFSERWLAAYDHPGRTLFFKPLGVFQSPLASAGRVADGWIHLLAALPSLRILAGGSESASRYMPAMALLWLSLIPIIAVHVLVFVALAGSMLSAETRVTTATIRQSWKAHCWPVFAVALVSFVVTSGLETAYVPLWPHLADLPFADAADAAVRVAIAAVGIAFMLAPFVIMGRGVGWRRGIVEGLRLLRRRWFALVTLFVLYRVGYEVVAVWNALSPWPTERRALTLTIPVPVLWAWVGEIGLALLGLWVAYAFVEIARGPVPAPVEQNRP